jgi:hypothetical protein
MNQLFIDKLHESMTESNKALIESVELLYRTCEKKAELESLKGTVGAAALGAALGAAGTMGVTHVDKIKGAINDAKTSYEHFVNDPATIQRVKNRAFEGETLLKNKGYHYVDVKDHPGLYSDELNGINLEQMDKEPYVQVGWWVSPDERTYYSTVTGEVYEMPKGQTFANASTDNKGNFKGHTPAATGVVNPDEVRDCSLTYKNMGLGYPEDGCGERGYKLLDDTGLKVLGATK